MDLPGECVEQVRQRKPSKRLVFDVDSSVSPTHGDRVGTAFNGHFECPDVHRDYHPLIVFNQHGDLE